MIWLQQLYQITIVPAADLSDSLGGICGHLQVSNITESSITDHANYPPVYNWNIGEHSRQFEKKYVGREQLLTIFIIICVSEIMHFL